ncbi:hypothetical protein [Ferdinandcohnia sp. SAFN-114]|uniref:hypothetical protein n=1 Tax=Ferdinandcohnia sp. SAFN-114 TaxID=3387275 RepID=UPI003F810616
MNNELHQKYKDITFPQELVSLFSDIVSSDETARKVCAYIGKTEQQQRKDEGVTRGVTINDIVENVMVERRTRVNERGRTYSYDQTKTNIHRKTAERQVDKLLDMSLLYYQSVKPLKFLYLTKRGWQVVEEIIKRSANKN